MNFGMMAPLKFELIGMACRDCSFGRLALGLGANTGNPAARTPRAAVAVIFWAV
jgi:hypothetical protein